MFNISQLGPFLVPSMLCLVWVTLERHRVNRLLAQGSQYRLIRGKERLKTSYMGLLCSLIVPVVALLSLR